VLAIFAGTGVLPRLVHAARPDAVVCELAGQPSALTGPGVQTWRVETLGTFLADLHARGVTEVCLAGGIRRPGLDPAAVDAATRPILVRLMGALVSGDDAALRAVMGVLEEAGFIVRAAQDIRPDLLPSPGVPTRAQPGTGVAADVDRGLAVIAAMGTADIGQACVVRAGQVVAIEATPGTDWMLASLSPAPIATSTGDPLTWAADGGRGDRQLGRLADRTRCPPARCSAGVLARHRRGRGARQGAETRAGSPRRPASNRAWHGRESRARGSVRDCRSGRRCHGSRPAGDRRRLRPVRTVPLGAGVKLYLVAGEPSGDRLGAALMAGIHALAPGVQVMGIGGPRMAEQGLASRVPMDELTVMGLAEILPKYRSLMRHISNTAQDVVREAPSALVTIDLPEFGLRVASRVRAANPGIRTIHYVAPSVWAWRPGRAAKMARHIDHVLALLPFEPPYMTDAGMGCDFVGHPVVADPVATASDIAEFRAAHAVDGGPLVVVLPGSRGGEVRRLLPVFGPALQALAARHPGLRVIVPLAAPVADLVTAAAQGWPGRPVLLDPRRQLPEASEAEKRAAFAAADAALAASGTVSLELAAQGCPMVVAYDFAPLTWFLMKRLVRVDTVTLVNLVSETRTVPEYLGPACRPGPIADALHRLLTDTAARDAQRAAMTKTMQRLGQGDDPPGLRAARAVLRVASGGQVPVQES